MKFVIKFKCPDASYLAMKDVHADGTESDVDAASALIDQFVEYGENVSIEFDTTTGTATVIKI